MSFGSPHDMTDYDKINIATESAFVELLHCARRLGLPGLPVMGMMELPNRETIVEFQHACRAVLELLRPPAPPASQPTALTQAPAPVDTPPV